MASFLTFFFIYLGINSGIERYGTILYHNTT